MKHEKKKKGLVKGMPSAVLVSILIHAILLGAAGGMVVFSVIKKADKKFVPPPPVERPKMDLKKPRVKVKKTAKPRATQRIATKSVASMPDMALPDMSGVGSGLSGGIGGYELVPDVKGMTMFGASESVAVGNDFEGTFYCFRYDRRGNEIGATTETDKDAMREFHQSGWNERAFAKYYRAPTKLYTTHFMIPPFPQELVPAYFGAPAGPEFYPTDACVIYRGQMMSKKGGNYRFRATCDGIFIVRVNGVVVIDEGWNAKIGKGEMGEGAITGLISSSEDNKTSGQVKFLSTVGEWFEMKPGVRNDMEVLMFNGGGRASWTLCIEDEDEEYPENPYEGGPVLPAFRTAQFSRTQREQIEYLLYRNDVEMVTGEIFNVY